MDILSRIGRDKQLFTVGMGRRGQALQERLGSSRFLVVGAAGSIGQAMTKKNLATVDPVFDHQQNSSWRDVGP